MSYSFTQAPNAMNIQEQEYGAEIEVRFSMFTSCIGLLALSGNAVTGIHLVMISNSDTLFDDAAAAAAVALLPAARTRIIIIGQIDFFSQAPGYARLLTLLNNPPIISVGDGIYGGRVNNGAFQTYQNGAYHNVP